MSLKDVIFGQLTNRCRSTATQVVEVSYSSTIGESGLFLKRDEAPIPTGTIVCDEYPIGTTAVAFFYHTGAYCSNCIKPLGEVDTGIACTHQCEQRYCSSNCLDRAMALYHSVLCTAANSAFKKYYALAAKSHNEYYIVAARLLVLFPNAPWVFHFHAPTWTTLDHDSSEQDLQDETDLMARHLRQVLRVAGRGTDAPKLTSDILSRTIGMLRINVLGLKYNETNVGFALYSTQSLMNHSADPNCRCVTICSDENPDNPCMCGIEAMKDLAPGDELTIDYVGGMELGSPERNKALLHQYGISEPELGIHQ